MEKKAWEVYQLKHHSWLTCLWLLQHSEELLGHHLYNEFQTKFGVGFFPFLSSPNTYIYVFCSLSSHCSPFSACTGSLCSPYSLDIFITHNCNWLSKSKHSGLVSQSANYGVINRKNLIKTFSSEMYSHGYSWRVESFSPIFQHHIYTFKSELLITGSSGTTLNNCHPFRMQFTWPILC